MSSLYKHQQRILLSLSRPDYLLFGGYEKWMKPRADRVIVIAEGLVAEC
jgi:hypothetical protein